MKTTARTRWWGMNGALMVLASATVLLAAPQAVASVSATPDETPKVNGTVYAVAQVGDLTIIGGEFTAVDGRPRLNAAAIHADGTLDIGFKPNLDGRVRAIAISEDGRTVFLGGSFTNAGGASRANLAAVDLATGAALPWQADTSGDYAQVHSLAVAGDRLYVGGGFMGIDGTVRHRLVAIYTTTGNVVHEFRSRVRGGGINEVVVSPDGNKVYAGGDFTGIGGAERPYGIAELWASSGDVTSFNPTEGGGTVITNGLSPDGSRLYVATANNSLFAYDLDSDAPTWVRKTSGDTQAIAASPTEVYIGGHFSQIVSYKIKRSFLASLNPVDGTVTDWDPNPEGGGMGVWAITLTPSALQVGGTFTSMNGVERRRFARFSGVP